MSQTAANARAWEVGRRGLCARWKPAAPMPLRRRWAPVLIPDLLMKGAVNGAAILRLVCRAGHGGVVYPARQRTRGGWWSSDRGGEDPRAFRQQPRKPDPAVAISGNAARPRQQRKTTIQSRAHDRRRCSSRTWRTGASGDERPRGAAMGQADRDGGHSLRRGGAAACERRWRG